MENISRSLAESLGVGEMIQAKSLMKGIAPDEPVCWVLQDKKISDDVITLKFIVFWCDLEIRQLEVVVP